jgi:hypothetical protein
MVADDDNRDAESTEMASELTKAEIGFVIKYFESAEVEARTTERYVLVGLGAIYTYLAAHVSDLPRIVWFAPPLVVFFAAVRALGMGWRQGQILAYLKQVESELAITRTGWAKWYKDQPPFVAVSAASFYVFLLVVTLGVAIASRRLFW